MPDNPYRTPTNPRRKRGIPPARLVIRVTIAVILLVFLGAMVWLWSWLRLLE
jgi:hypothetical protein